MKFKSPRTPHLIGSGIPDSGNASERLDWNHLSGRHVVLEEKIDGSEVSFHFDSDVNLIARERANVIDQSSRGGAEKHLDAYKDWLTVRAGDFFERIEDRYIVYAEWCALAHCIFYDALPDCFVEIDVQDKRTGEFLSTDRRVELLAGLGVVQAPVLFEGSASRQSHPREFVTRSAFASADPHTTWRASNSRLRGGSDSERFDLTGLSEGIYGKIEEGGVVVERFKWIREDFVRRIVCGGRHWRMLEPTANVVADQNPSSFSTLTF
ncbi:RNA ligase family protein [Agrobacterium rubi]|nr:RNA ligase family protein [Agrobacterium rubi]NTF24825.1 RNA ligase family protein [Agrobacterium rubi]